jgi:hypothetical protein
MARKTTAPQAEVAVEAVDTGGLGIDEGIVLATFFLLIAAVLLVYFASQHYTP